MTIKQQELADKHGTPDQFRKAVQKALGTISIDEMNQAIQNYQAEWNVAGQTIHNCFILMDPKTKEPVCVAQHEDELEACQIQRGISTIEFKKRRLYVTKGTFTLGIP